MSDRIHEKLNITCSRIYDRKQNDDIMKQTQVGHLMLAARFIIQVVRLYFRL